MKHDVLAREWFYDLLTRPNIRISQLGVFAPNIIYDTLPYLEYRIKGKKKRVKKYFLRSSGFFPICRYIINNSMYALTQAGKIQTEELRSLPHPAGPTQTHREFLHEYWI